MTDREKLIKFLDVDEIIEQTNIIKITDYLINNNVIVQEKGKWLDGHCTNCGCRELGLFDAKNYCPNCGAKMDEVSE